MPSKLLARTGSVILAGGILFSSVFVMPVQAQTLQDQIQNRVNQAITNRCDRVTAKVDERIDNYNQNKDAHLQRFQSIKTTVTNLVNKLNSQGYDTTAVVANLQTLGQKVQVAADAYSTFINTLESSKAYACGNSEGQFRDTISKALSQLRTFRTDTEDIMTFVRTTLRPSIQALRDQHPQKSNS